MREDQGSRRGTAGAGQKRGAVLDRPRRVAARREQAKSSGADAKAKIIAKLRRLHPMD